MTISVINADNLELIIAEKQSPYRNQIEKIIQEKYYAVYKATLYHFAPTLFALHSKGKILATLGVTFARAHPLFLEQYFKAPIDDIITAEVSDPIKLNQLIEFGHFTAYTPAAGKNLICTLAAWLHILNIDIQYALVTLTAPMAGILKKFRLPLKPLQSASAECLPEKERKRWGEYYIASPCIYYMDIKNAVSVLRVQSPKAWQRYLNLANHAVKQYSRNKEICTAG